MDYDDQYMTEDEQARFENDLKLRTSFELALGKGSGHFKYIYDELVNSDGFEDALGELLESRDMMDLEDRQLARNKFANKVLDLAEEIVKKPLESKLERIWNDK